MFLLLSNQPFKLSTVVSTKQNQREVKPLYFSWTLITLWTIGISRPSTLKTTISPALIGSSRKFVRNRRSPLWKAGSMLPLERNTKSHQNYVHTRWIFQPIKNTTNIPLRISVFINSQAGLWYKTNQSNFLLTAQGDNGEKGNDFFLDLSMKRALAGRSAVCIR